MQRVRRVIAIIAVALLTAGAGEALARAETGVSVCSQPGQVIVAGTRDRCCWPGQRWSKKYRRCTGAPITCPPEHHADGERCVIDQDAFSRYLRDVVRHGVPALRRCYERALKTHPDLRVRTGPRFTISPDGTVKRVVLDPSLPPPLADCITIAIRSWRFPPLAGEVEISYPLNVDPVE